MTSMYKLIRSHRTLFAQLIFTVIAFVAMFTLSYVFMRSTVHNTLLHNADAALDSSEERINVTLQEFESTLNGFAEEVRTRVLRGDDTDALWEYIEAATEFTFLDSKKLSGIQDFFGYFESSPEDNPVLIYSSRSERSADYQPEEQDWYQLALEADGQTIETTPSIIRSDQTLCTYAKCIFDNKGRRLGVIGMNVSIDLLGQNIIDTTLNQGGYGMLLNQDGQVLFHLNTAFRGKTMYDSEIPLSEYAEDIDSGVAVLERPLISYKGDEVVVFIRTLSNGWHIGLLTPDAQYYGTITTLGMILGVLAALLMTILLGILIRLDRARIKSDKENQQKSSFLANMSHEIRTPINAIVGMTAIGRTAGVIERKDYCFKKIDGASRHLLGVINDILV